VAVAVAATAVGFGLLTAAPAGAYLGCPLGAGAVKGKVVVESGVPAVKRVDNTSYNGDLMTQNTPFPLDVHPGGSGEFHYCGKSVFTWPVETTTQYRINGPKVGKDVTGYLVDIHTKIPLKGDNEYTCSVRQEYGPKTVDPFFCSAKGTDSGSRYAIIADFTIGVKKLQTVTDPHDEARLLAQKCLRADLTQCVFDPKDLSTNIYGPEVPVSAAVDAHCDSDTTHTFTWSQTISTTENIGATGSVTVSIGQLVPIVQASVSATYGFSWTQIGMVGGTVPYHIPAAHRLHVVRRALLNEVSGRFVLVGNGDTNYVVPHATFKWMDRSEQGIISPKKERLPNCPAP